MPLAGRRRGGYNGNLAQQARLEHPQTLLQSKD
jgi:hypothetical protein